MYCKEIEKIIELKRKKKTDLLEDLKEIKTEGNYGKIKSSEIQIQLIQQQIKQNEIILKTLLLECPRDSTEYEMTCINKCKWYYDNIIKK